MKLLKSWTILLFSNDLVFTIIKNAMCKIGQVSFLEKQDSSFVLLNFIHVDKMIYFSEENVPEAIFI